ncbi:MAG: xanthine dehydrogenase family protein molybdopterin-binding subunit [Rhodospirillaceae bacterium]|nr:xanthine dehydrogenase family protein molybdopterin-binding subunit [Rhodospirillaceae bacterium]
MKLSRRGMILSGLAVGGGLAVAYGMKALDDGDARVKFGASTPEQFVLHAYVKISTDGRITVAVPQAELGQGVTTAIPMMVAEELDADWEQVAYELAPLDKAYGSYATAELTRIFMQPGLVADTARWALWQASPLFGLIFTGGSSAVFGNYEFCRSVGATARAMLIKAAAKTLEVSESELTTQRSRVLHPGSGRALTYGELAALAASFGPAEVMPRKTQADFTIIGQPKPRLDTPEKIDGSGRYGIDVHLPGMVYAAVRHSPVFKGTVSSFDAEAAKRFKGVIDAFQITPDAVAVVAENTWAAHQAARALPVSFAPPPTPAYDSTLATATYPSLFDAPDPAVLHEDEGFAAAMAASARTVEAVYETPHLAHLCMEPMGCSALYEPSPDNKPENAKVTVWSPSQSMTFTSLNARRLTGAAADNVTVHATLMGGGFGRRADMDFVREAVAIAMKIPGRPVKLTWSREEDVTQDTYRPATAARFRAGLDASGAMTALDFVIVGKTVSWDFNQRNKGMFNTKPREDKGMVMPMISTHYAFPKMRLAINPQDNPVPSGNWRSVTMSHNGFYQEAFLDEVAEATGQDPVAFRRTLLKDKPKHLAVLNVAAEKAGWGTPLTPDPNGGRRGRGIAALEAFASIVAQVVEVTVAPDGALKVDRVISCVDCHTAVNPNIIAAQIEGSVIDALSAALYGQIDVKNGAVVQSNFSDYRLMKMSEAPVLETHVMPQGGHPGGMGEVGVPGVAPALVNAIYAATGKRVRKLPVAPAGVVAV